MLKKLWCALFGHGYGACQDGVATCFNCGHRWRLWGND